MASFKINIADPKAGKCYKTEVKDQQAESFIGLNVGEKIEGSKLGMDGYELMITGGSDYCGFPMRHGILGLRKRITIYKGAGFRGGLKGMKKRKTVCGHKINDKISALNLKVLKEGTKKLSEMFGAAEKPREESKKEGKEKTEGKKQEKKIEQKPEAKEEKKEVKQEKKIEQKESKEEIHKQEEKN